MNVYILGEHLQLHATFRRLGVAVQPTTVELKVRRTGGDVVHTYQGAAPADITMTTALRFELDLALDVVGDWEYRWKSTGTGAAVGKTRKFKVVADELA